MCSSIDLGVCTATHCISGRVEEGISRNVNFVNLHPFRRRDSLETRWNNRVQAKRLVKTGIQICELPKRHVIRLLVSLLILIDLSLKLAHDLGMVSQEIDQTACGS